MDKVWASVPRPDVKLDQAIARNSKRRNPVEFRSGAVGKIVWWSDPDEPFLALHRPEALADAPMTRHVGEYKSPFLQVHNPQSRRAIREGQFGLFHAGFSARCARPDDFTIWRKRLRLQILSGELNHGVCGHGHPPFCATAQEPEPANVSWQALRYGAAGKSDLLDAARISRAIEFTRFPIPEPDDQDDEEGSLARAANLIGQLGDPHYLRKANALYHEFDEVGMNTKLGYASHTDLMDLYPQFYFNNVSAYLQTAIRYLNVTSSGRMWIASLIATSSGPNES